MKYREWVNPGTETESRLAVAGGLGWRGGHGVSFGVVKTFWNETVTAAQHWECIKHPEWCTLKWWSLCYMSVTLTEKKMSNRVPGKLSRWCVPLLISRPWVQAPHWVQRLLDKTNKQMPNNEMVTGHNVLDEEQVICCFLVCHNFDEFSTGVNPYIKSYPLEVPNQALMKLRSLICPVGRAPRRVCSAQEALKMF